ncbi:hypothetical protein K491DRAFT_124116 [Lophiostoma macrostomum CBS 122681]|uniref:Uncharacterized protein n=1 Tax=Lophiostoma macrostomum CBS 122681 TaxID=1314788 RepID=A0A6A6TIW3_9PLEO|nr:hypothetical protein K491DRAFT_124116 [Lophiostoma macrostomum CBS 122681]
MFLDMLTADAAAKHGHEYSTPSPSDAPADNGSFFSQMPLSLLSSVLRKRVDSPAPADAHPDDIKAADAPGTPEPPNLMITAPRVSPASPTPSRPASAGSIASLESKPRKRASRSKTTYKLAQPPPSTTPRQKLHLRPKVLLQLHQVILSQRPKPVYEVIPYSLLAPRSTRRLARTFNTRDKLGPSDLLIVKAEEYGSKDAEHKSDDERWGSRDVIGIICPPKKLEKDCSEKTELLLDDGSIWEVTNMTNGGYEFCFTDDHGLPIKRRWITKSPHVRRVSTMSSTSQALASPTLGPEDRVFKFSTISAYSRRHPIIASMSRSAIDVLDTYNMPTATSPPTPDLNQSVAATPLDTPSSLFDPSAFLDSSGDQIPITTDDALRRFIVVSGIWVAFSENWSPAYTASRNPACPSPLATSWSARPAGPTRAVSMSFVDSPRSVSPASVSDENRKSIPRLFRTGTQKLHSSASFASSVSSPTFNRGSPSSSPLPKTRSRRSNSTGTADLRTRNGSTRKRFGLALEDQPVEESEEERQSKRSIELLRIKELALPDTPNTPAATPTPIQIIEPSTELSLPSPASPSKARTTKSQSAYNPVTTAGLWDSGVVEGNGLKSRPTSMVVMQDKNLCQSLFVACSVFSCLCPYYTLDSPLLAPCPRHILLGIPLY